MSTVRRLHHPALESAALSPNAPLAVTGSADARARVWDLVSGALVRELSACDPARDDGISALAFSMDGALLWAGTRRGDLFAWDVASGAVVRRHSLGHPVSAVLPVVGGVLAGVSDPSRGAGAALLHVDENGHVAARASCADCGGRFALSCSADERWLAAVVVDAHVREVGVAWIIDRASGAVVHERAAATLASVGAVSFDARGMLIVAPDLWEDAGVPYGRGARLLAPTAPHEGVHVDECAAPITHLRDGRLAWRGWRDLHVEARIVPLDADGPERAFLHSSNAGFVATNVDRDTLVVLRADEIDR